MGGGVSTALNEELSKLDGSGSSILNDEEKVIVTQGVNKQYEYCSALGTLSDAQIQDYVTREYHKQIQLLHPEYVIPELPKVESNDNNEQTQKQRRGSREGSLNNSRAGSRRNSKDSNYLLPTASVESALQDKELEKNKKVKKRGGTRRRSFDRPAMQEPLLIKMRHKEHLEQIFREESTANKAVNEEVTETVSAEQTKQEEVLPEPAPESKADSWDSITQQPFCNLCKMAFKSITFRDRHISYSDIHKSNLKKKELKETEQNLVEEGTLPIPMNYNEHGKPIEGKHFKLLYQGVKLFWQTQQSYDIHIYHHLLAHTIEVIIFNVINHKEQPRVYLDYTDMVTNIEPTIEEPFAEKIREIATDRFATIDRVAIKEDLIRNAIIYTIIQRLKISEENNEFVIYKPFQSDKKNPVREKMPAVVIPILVRRRRGSKAEEIDAAIEAVSDDLKEASKHLTNAEKIANLVHQGALRLQTKKWYHLQEVSKYQRLWIKAINRVLCANRKKHMIQFLTEKGLM